MRPIDADAMLAELRPITQEMEHSAVTIADMSNIMRNWVGRQPTLTPPNEWVSVEERLPEPEFDGQQRGFYLVALSNGVVKELAYEFRHYENMIFDVGWHETAHPVTHWMSLPEPPAKES